MHRSRFIATTIAVAFAWLMLVAIAPPASAFQGGDAVQEPEVENDVAGFAADLVATAEAESSAYGGLHECGSGSLRSRIGEYWQDIGISWNGCTDQPWSAAFISAMVKAAGAGSEFRYSAAHREYIHDAFAGGRGLYGSVVDTNGANAVVGDLVCSGRGRVSHWSYASFSNWYASGAGDAIPTHCDIVVAVNGNSITVIGGNVGDAVTRKTVALTSYAIVLPLSDPLAWEAEAFEEASAELEEWMKEHPPSFRIWPHPDSQVVLLESFLWIADEGWQVQSFSHSVHDVEVSVTATPIESYWVFTETATGETVTMRCIDDPSHDGHPGRGDHFDAGETDATCGHTFEHSSSVTGLVQLGVCVGFELTVVSSLPDDQSNFVDGEITATGVESGTLFKLLTVNEVLAYGVENDNDLSATQKPAVTIHPEDSDGFAIRSDVDDGQPCESEPDDGEPDIDGLPVETLICTGTISAAADFVVAGADGEISVQFILETFPDGTQVLTRSADVGLGGGGPGNATGGGFIQVGDVSVGAYAEASTAVVGTLGGGTQYIIPADEDFETYLLSIYAAETVAPLTHGFNAISPWDVPTGPTPSAVFVDGAVRFEGGAIGTVGNGWVSAIAEADISAQVHQTAKYNNNTGKDDTVSAITNISVEGGVEGLALAGIPHLSAWVAETNANFRGSVEIETIYALDGTPLEVKFTLSGGADGDAHVAGDSDTTTIHSQQWTWDLTDPEAAAALSSLDEYATLSPALIASNGELPPSWDDLTEHAQTSGRITQQLEEHNFDARAGGGLGVGGNLGLNVNCLELTGAAPGQTSPVAAQQP